MDLFKWSVPFLIEKIGAMMDELFKKSRARELQNSASAEEPNTPTSAAVTELLTDQVHAAAVEKKRKREVLKQKIMFVGRMSRMLKTIR